MLHLLYASTVSEVDPPPKALESIARYIGELKGKRDSSYKCRQLKLPGLDHLDDAASIYFGHAVPLKSEALILSSTIGWLTVRSVVAMMLANGRWLPIISSREEPHEYLQVLPELESILLPFLHPIESNTNSRI